MPNRIPVSPSFGGYPAPALACLVVSFFCLFGGSSPAAAFNMGPEVAAISPDGARLYVANNLLNTIAVVDTATNQIAATVLLNPDPGAQMEGMVVSPDGSRLYISATAGAPANPDPISPDPLGPLTNVVLAIDTTTLQVVARVEVGWWPMGLAISPDGMRAYVANFRDGTVSVMDTAMNQVTATVDVGGNPKHVAVSPDGARLYVGNSDGNSQSFPVLDAATPRVVATVGTGLYPSVVAASPNGKWLYVTGCCGPSRNVDVIDAGTQHTVTQVATEDSPMGVAFSPDSARAYVTVNSYPGTVAVIDTATDQVVDTITAGYFSQNVVMRPDGKRLYTVDMYPGTVTVIDTGTNKVATEVPVYLKPTPAGP